VYLRDIKEKCIEMKDLDWSNIGFGYIKTDYNVRCCYRDGKWGDIFMDGLFLGMISAFLGVVFADVSLGLAGWIPVFVMIASAIIMLICGALKIFLKAKWIEDYALPISLLGGMALSLPITDLVNSLV
jgi:hypothetical protein